jgi:hypothetical protein
MVEILVNEMNDFDRPGTTANMRMGVTEKEINALFENIGSVFPRVFRLKPCKLQYLTAKPRRRKKPINYCSQLIDNNSLLNFSRARRCFVPAGSSSGLPTFKRLATTVVR